MKTRGMTMVELMIVIGIIALLAAIIIPNMIRAKMAANETACIAQIKKFGTSQEIYRRTDWDGNGVKEYAQNIGPNGGNGNGESLYKCNRFNVVTGLEDDSMVPAEIPGTGNVNGTTPRTGYLYFVQLGTTFPQVNNYVNVNGNMISGYAVNAVPAQYDFGGRSSYQMDSAGVIYKKDSGNSNITAAYNVNPTNGWLKSED